ncbi:histidine kinase dimerization/phosphoacceptor domain -containing protein [Pseudodesulfovibrio pelocollis]|uniref:histidine kinase dimerization/phosphoacceptor domain -containing protein n=1 Tax=Pseudodesulfovibrio pelocollis TaxID=3051432 RepID=UPI00255AB42F|nr:histidine kinase dimerization/phosphoacceptor domain -containing protein [Pseudodesulfovibrio sp. SB368]
MPSRFCKVAKVSVAGQSPVILPVSGLDKPDISPVVMDKWQNLSNLAAKATGAAAGLVMRIHPEDIEVCISSKGPDNPYKPEEHERLGLGLYCETVLGTRNILNIPDALADPQWKDNPDISRGMVAYLGMPIKWPDDEIFGTICVLDRSRREFSVLHIELLAHLRMAVETDLHMLCERQRLERLCHEKTLALREAHHRIKNHLQLLSGVIHLRALNDTPPEAEMAGLLDDLTGRIQAIAMLHSHMTTAEDDQLAFDGFLESIASTIINSLAQRPVVLRLETAPVIVNRRAFFHAGLLVSELVTNALKHAFADTPQPEIGLLLADIDEDSFTLRVRDNGCGLPEGFAPEGCDSIGMTLISNLPQQMNGTCTVSTDHGAIFDFVLEKRPGEPDPPMNPPKNSPKGSPKGRV